MASERTSSRWSRSSGGGTVYTIDRNSCLNLKSPYRPPLSNFWCFLFDLGYEAVGELDARLELVEDWTEPFRKGVSMGLSSPSVALRMKKAAILIG